MQAPFVKSLRCAALSSAFLATSWVLAGSWTANAQEVVPPPPPGPPPAVVETPPPPPPGPPPGYMFDMTSIGKPYGEMLKGYGIYLNGGTEVNFFGYLGGRKQGTQGQGEATLGVDLDLNRMFGIPGAAIHVSTDDRWGANPNRFVGAGIFSTANYGPQDNYRLGELSWDQDLFNDHVRILVGRIADNIDFSGSELYCQYLFSICGNLFNAWYFNNANPSYPVAALGGRVTSKPSLETYLRFGAYQETSVAGTPNHTGWPGSSWDFAHNTGVFIPVEIGYKTSFAVDPFPRGFYLGGWYDSSRYSQVLTGHPEQGRSGVYFAMQQMIFRPDMNAKRGITVFGGAEFDTANAGPAAYDISGGVSWRGPLFGRPADTLNLGAQYWNWNRNTALASQLISGFRMPRSEWQLEVNYTYALAPGVSVIPVVGYQINPDGGLAGAGLFQPNGRPPKNAWILGAQLAIGLNGAFGLPSFARTN
jgi:porin